MFNRLFRKKNGEVDKTLGRSSSSQDVKQAATTEALNAPIQRYSKSSPVISPDDSTLKENTMNTTTTTYHDKMSMRKSTSYVQRSPRRATHPQHVESKSVSNVELETSPREFFSAMKGDDEEEMVGGANYSLHRFMLNSPSKDKNVTTPTTPTTPPTTTLDVKQKLTFSAFFKKKTKGITKAASILFDGDMYSPDDDGRRTPVSPATPSFVPSLNISALGPNSSDNNSGMKVKKSPSIDIRQKRTLSEDSLCISTNSSPTSSSSGSGSFKSPSPLRTTSAVRIQALNMYVHYGSPRNRKDSRAELLLPAEPRVRKPSELQPYDPGSFVRKRTNSRKMSVRGRPSSLTLSSRVTNAVTPTNNQIEFEMQLKDEIEQSCSSSPALDAKFYNYCLEGNYAAVQYMLVRRVFTCQIKGNTGKRCTVNISAKQGNDDETALHAAARHNHDSIVELLLIHGADPDTKDKSLRTPLHMAASKGSQNAAIVLMANGAKINITDLYGFSPLNLCLKGHYFTLASDMFLFSADINFRGSKGSTVLHDAMARGDIEVLKFLLDLPVQNRVLLNHRDERGDTPLMRAIQNGHTQCVEYLLSKRSDVNLTSVNDRGQNLFHICAQCTGEKKRQTFDILVRLIMKHSSYDKSKIQALINQKDKVRESTPLHLAALNDNEPMLSGICTTATQIGVDLNAVDKFSNTVTHLVIARYNKADTSDKANICYSMICKLMSMGSSLDLNIPNRDNVTVKAMYRAMNNPFIQQQN
jgi:ankyrin repeat protein